jgi:ABC-2 type transport system ATP-binding protein
VTVAERLLEGRGSQVVAQRTVSEAIELTGVCRRFRGGRGVGPVDLEVFRGETFALMGANGAGKTTLLRILATLDRVEAGAVRWWGSPSPDVARGSIGFSPDAPVEEEVLSPRQTTYFWCRQWMRDGMTARRRTEVMLERFGLRGVADEPVSACSFGMRRRLSLAQALVHEPNLALLDEPTAGLDPDGVMALAEELARRERLQATTIVASNDPAFIEMVATRVALLECGEVLRVATPAELLDEAGSARLAILTLRGAPCAEELSAIPGVADVAIDGAQVRVRFRGDAVLPRLVAAADAPGGRLADLVVRDPDLRDCLTRMARASCEEGG